MDEYLNNGNGYMLCFSGTLTTQSMDIIKDYIRKSNKYIYLDLKNCTGITSMRDGNFANLEYLAGIKLPHDVNNMGKRIFENCRNLTNVMLPLSLVGIGDYSFQNTDKLKEMHIPDTIAYMYQYAFKNCSLEIFVMPDNLKRLGVEGLMGAKDLKIIVVNQVFEWFRARSLVDTPNLETIIYYGTKLSTVQFEGNSVFSGKPQKEITLYLPNVERGEEDFSRWGGYGWKDVKYQGEFNINELLGDYNLSAYKSL
ncbi:hypothetical protein BHWA1_02398 [Brachyspira hyodysenteriae WA1]|nr:hypothetical protein BHWA1_02398 [Brachyspira hyodysenteriae WA1]